MAVSDRERGLGISRGDLGSILVMGVCLDASVRWHGKVSLRRQLLAGQIGRLPPRKFSASSQVSAG